MMEPENNFVKQLEKKGGNSSRNRNGLEGPACRRALSSGKDVLHFLSNVAVTLGVSAFEALQPGRVSSRR